MFDNIYVDKLKFLAKYYYLCMIHYCSQLTKCVTDIFYPTSLFFFFFFLFFFYIAQCPVTTNPNNGDTNIETNGLVSTAYYKCDQGYVLYGTAEIKCTASGTWETVPPICGRC